ncbi:InlB B-repeat-containing protein [Lachnospiraceae bacterium 54-53]
MKNRKKQKAQTAWVLAAVMVITMAAPPASLAALSYGDPSIVQFDPQNGPDLSHSTYANVPRYESGISYATGQAGYALCSSEDFNGIETVDRGSGPRPGLPEFKVEWPGYTFDGWYGADGNKVLNLPYAFPYVSPETYQAVWNGNSSSRFDFTVMHYRDLNGERDSMTDGSDPSAWPSDGDSQVIRFFDDGTWTNPVTANTPVSATYKRNIPGYKLKSVLIKNNRIRRFDDETGTGTLEEAATVNSSTNAVRGYMPNDDLMAAYRYEPDAGNKFTMRVEYVDGDGTAIKTPDYTTHIIVNTVDNHNNILAQPQDLSVSPSESVELAIERKSGYSYPPNITWNGNFSGPVLYETEETFTFQTGITGGSVTITYNEDLTDPDYWARVDYYNSPGGALSGDSSPKFFRLNSDPQDSYPIGELTGNITPSPGAHYLFDGWYKANSSGTGKTGGKLTGDVRVTENLKLYANFEEDPNEWFDITFVSGNHGSLSGSAGAHVAKGTVWTDLDLPSPRADSNYLFNGWYDENGNRVQNSLQILSDHTYTARFTPIAGDDGILSIPDADGSVSADGTGQVRINGANEERKYAVTDEEGIVISFMTGSQLKDGKFTGLDPCTYYYVYELSLTAFPAAGEPLAGQVDGALTSQPARTGILTLGNNYSVADDGNGGRKKITIHPAAGDTLYALLDGDGNAVSQTGSAEGWLGASGSPAAAVFTDLESGQTYTAVAKQPGETESPSEKALLGSPVLLEESSQAEDRDCWKNHPRQRTGTALCISQTEVMQRKSPEMGSSWIWRRGRPGSASAKGIK